MISRDDIVRLSAAERLALIGDLWDSMAEAETPLSQPQQEELMRRLASFDVDKERSVTWEALKAELKTRTA